jgi:hypothetical protein
MGGCLSTWNSLELAGGFIGVGVATLASGGTAAAASVVAAGSLGAYFSTKKGCNKDKSALIQATNEIVATAIVNSLNQCNSLEASTQDIEITCFPNLPDGTVYEMNSSCGVCNRAVFLGMLAQHEQERKVWARGGEVKVRLPINEEYVLMLGRLGTCGINSCKACSLANVTQTNILTGNSQCYDQLRSTTNFQTNLSSLISQQLLANQDVLSGAATALGATGVDNITEKVVNQISAQVTSNFLNETIDKMTNSQIIQLKSNGKTTFNNISMLSAFNIALESVTQSEIVTRAISESMFSLIAQIADEQNTLNDVGTVVFEAVVTFQTAVDNIVGRVMVAVLVSLGLVVLAIVVYAFYKFIRGRTIQSINLAKKLELQTAQMSATQQF